MEHSKVKLNTSAPQLKKFVDYREFLRAWYDFKKVENPQFSYAVWATKTGFKSRSFIRLVMLGKRALGVDSIPIVIKSLGLQGDDPQYFTYLVHFAHSNSIESRDYYFNEILKLSKGTGAIVKDTYRFLSHLKTARVNLLINLKGFKGSIEDMANLLELSVSEVKDILENLEHLGLVSLNKDQNIWQGATKELKLPGELGNLALQSFHSQSLKEAQGSIQLDPRTRHYGSVLMFLDTEKYSEMTRELEQFCEYLGRKYHTASEILPSKIYQINLNLIPASKEIIRTQKKARSEAKDSKVLSDETQEIQI